jgi:hypothetical protein
MSYGVKGVIQEMLAYLVHINMVNPGWYSRNRRVEQEGRGKSKVAPESSRLASTGVWFIT